MTTAAIIYEGVRRRFTEARLAKALGKVEGLYVHPAESPLYALQDAGLGEEEAQLLQAVDGHKTVATLRALDLLPPLETDRFLYAMRCAQMIELRDKPSEGKPRQTLKGMMEVAAKPPPLPPPPPPTPALGSKPAGRKGSLLPELSEVVSTKNLSSEESLLRERLVAKVGQMRKMDYFEILGLSQNASREEIKRAYFALAKEHHPDKHFGSASAEVRHLAGQIYDLISTAHDTLTDPTERERYVKELASGVKRDIGDEVGKILAAEGKFQKGEELLRQNNVPAAHQLFREAIDLYAQEGEFHAYLGWTQFQLNPADSDGALKSLEKAVTLNPKVDKGYLFTGYIYKATGRPDKAEKQFEKAIQCNPDCTEALRELRILGKGRR
jgi:curved DNA-binding protein CbpA